jgi:acetyl-CoA acetyltransferase
MGDHTEDTAEAWTITREAQDEWAYRSHMRAVAGWEGGFYSDLVLPLSELARDANPRPDTSLERLAALPPAFDRTSGHGTLTAGKLDSDHRRRRLGRVGARPRASAGGDPCGEARRLRDGRG